MNINMTLMGQMITFALFVMFTMKYVWPPIMQALEDRQTKIAEGLAAAERSQHDLELARTKSAEYLRDAKQEASSIIDKANKRSTQLIDEAKDKAREEGKRLMGLAQMDIAREVNSAKQALRQQVAGLALSGAEQLLGRHLDDAANSDILDSLIKEL